MPILVIDTSGSRQAVVLLDGEAVIAGDEWTRTRDDVPLLTRVDALVSRAGSAAANLSAVAAARGPGSFTGLRPGLGPALGGASGPGGAPVPVGSLRGLGGP